MAENREADMDRIKVLFVCVYNSARSQMAEAFLEKYGGDRYEAESAGLEPGRLNPVVAGVMGEVGIDISQKKAKSVFEVYKSGRLFDFVVTVCDSSVSEKCPIFSGNSRRLHWEFPDPSAFTGSPEEILGKTREVRDLIGARVRDWIAGG
jgi:arsenate reductase